MVRALAFGMVATAVWSSGCSGRVAAGETDGRVLFEASCAPCHGPNGEPTPDGIAKGVRDLTSPAFRARVSRELVIRQVEHGSPNKGMPPFAGVLSPAQIDAVARYVVSLPAGAGAPSGR
jgi:mono/diheme cytochrome c family protein